MNRSIFDARHTTALRRAISKRVLLAFDFDGTLAPIVAGYTRARMRPATRDLLRHVARLHPTVILTGRSVRDVAKRLTGVPLAAIVGNHGLETRGVPSATAALVRRWRVALRSLERIRGVEIEDKRASLAIHYRRAADPSDARRRIMRAVAALIPLPRVVAGKSVVNVLPDVGVNKGTALRELIRRHRVRRAIYVGDDVTDEDVFDLPASVRILTIRVGRAHWSAARYHIVSQRQIDMLLALIIDERPVTV